MFKEKKIKSEYSGFIDLVIDKKNDKTITILLIHSASIL